MFSKWRKQRGNKLRLQRHYILFRKLPYGKTLRDVLPFFDGRAAFIFDEKYLRQLFNTRGEDEGLVLNKAREVLRAERRNLWNIVLYWWCVFTIERYREIYKNNMKGWTPDTGYYYIEPSPVPNEGETS